jgi:hypothetical protein
MIFLDLVLRIRIERIRTEPKNGLTESKVFPHCSRIEQLQVFPDFPRIPDP